MIILKKFSKKKEDAKKVGGSLAVGSGLYIADKVHKSGEISGRMRLYHGTSKKAKKKIQEEGLKAIHALDENNITRKAGIDPGNKPVVYTARKRKIALGHTLPHLIEEGEAGLVKMSIPYDEYKKMKRSYENTEMAGAKNAKEYAEMIKKGKTPNVDGDVLKGFGVNVDKFAKQRWDNLSGAKGTGGTRIFEQDIDTKRIKGSKNYIRNSAKEVFKYAKNNPKRFAKGVGKGAVSTGLIAGGAILTTGGKNKDDKS